MRGCSLDSSGVDCAHAPRILMIMAVQSKARTVCEVDSIQRPQCGTRAFNPALFHAVHDLADEQSATHLFDHPETNVLAHHRNRERYQISGAHAHVPKYSAVSPEVSAAGSGKDSVSARAIIIGSLCVETFGGWDQHLERPYRSRQSGDIAMLPRGIAHFHGQLRLNAQMMSDNVNGPVALFGAPYRLNSRRPPSQPLRAIALIQHLHALHSSYINVFIFRVNRARMMP